MGSTDFPIHYLGLAKPQKREHYEWRKKAPENKIQHPIKSDLNCILPPPWAQVGVSHRCSEYITVALLACCGNLTREYPTPKHSTDLEYLFTLRQGPKAETP